ncbi:unnamed protein product, partial [Adineta steineri]
MLYAFLFKLTHGENDLCISCLNANRYKTELQNMMGMFVSTLPYRIQLDPHCSFDDLVEYVREKCLSILEHSHYPLQHILANLHINKSNISFLETMFDFITLSSHSDELSLNDASFKQVSFERSFEVAKFDFMLTFIYNPMLENNRLSFRLTCSRDLFDEITVTNIGQRLEYYFQQLYSSNETINRIDTCVTSIWKINLILPEETEEMENTAFCRQSHIINEAPASFAQALLWHNESMHFTPHMSQVPIYNMPFVYHLHSHHTLSVQHLRQALHLIVTKHESLRTSLIFQTENNRAVQQIIDFSQNNNTLFTFIESTYTTHEQLNGILYDEKYNSHLFDLVQGLAFRCHIVYYKQISSNHLLSHKDMLIFNFHHALFDFPSMQLFLHGLNQAYTANQLLYDDDTTLRYIDYAVIEQQMPMTGASMFWLGTLHDCKLEQSLSLPFDRYRLANEHRTGRGTSISFDFGQDISHDFLIHASSNNISLEHLTFAIYFIFLFKLTNGQTDLCLAMNINNNRYRDELKYIIGLFENVIPLRCQLDPHWCFHQLLEHVREITTNSMKYSYFPLQHILNQYPHISKHAFLNTSLEFLSCAKNNDNIAIMISDSQIVPASFLFNDNEDETLILPNERLLLQSLNSTQISFSSPFTSIHHAFMYQVIKHPQKLAVELDDQSLTYCELLYYVQVLSLTLVNEYHVIPGEIVFQCVERSLSMVIGIMAIEMAGGIYCPLSPRDPQHRLHALIQQVESRLVLVHHATNLKLSNEIVVCNVDVIWNAGHINSSIIMNRLSDIVLTIDNIAYIVFTSGSTGTSKGVQIHHRNLLACTDSLVRLSLFTNRDTMIQMASCSYDVHAREIIGGLITGSTIIMLRPQGNMDLDYMMNTLNGKQVSYLQCVPTYANVLLEFLQSHSVPNLSTLRTFDIGGETSTVQLIDKLYSYLPQICSVWNIYGPAETTVDCTGYVIGRNLNMTNIPIGCPLPNYRCTVMSEYLQSSVSGQEGELLIGGVGVFAGYLGRDDLTAKALIEINGQLFYRTGDLVTIDNNGLLHYQGRKDHQIKLHGQRIELGEIERCLLSITSISTCVVMKWKDDYLIAYVQSSHINEEQLREHCQSHLPPHMIPSVFIILDKLPLNPNGKIDRKQLPSPTFTHLSSNQLKHNSELLLPTNDIEVSIHRIWCEIFKQNQISTDTNIFTIGGHSLLMMQLFHQYKIEFHLEQKQSSFSISNLFKDPTIMHHAQLIQRSINTIHALDDCPWSSLYIIQARASFAQERIYLDEQIRFSTKKTTMNNMYVISFLYRVSSMNDHISITRLHHAFQSVIAKHNTLRTALFVDTNGHIMQHCLDANIILEDHSKSRELTVVNIRNGDRRRMNEIIEEILNQSDLFELSKGHVIRCHILRHCDYSQDSISYENDDLLSENDYILISIHHAMFDGASTSIFLRDLSLAYQSSESLSMDDNSLEYIDYSVHEHIMNMSLSHEFWLSQLERCNIERSLSLPVDRQRSSTNQQRSGLASIAEITFDNEICTSFLSYASSHHLTYFQLGLSIFYVFLFKLTHGESDLCIGSINANRYRNELQNLIGMFVSTLPYRLQIDSHWSFDELVQHVREKCLLILEHSHYPLQHILSDNRLNQSNVSFLEIIFDFISISKDVEHLCLSDANLEQISLEQSAEMSKFDFSLTFEYNPLSDNKRLSCHFVCSHDLFEKSTISKIAQRFEYMFEQLFQIQSSNTSMIDRSSSINKVCLILPEEAEEMELVVFNRLESVVNE